MHDPIAARLYVWQLLAMYEHVGTITGKSQLDVAIVARLDAKAKQLSYNI